MAKDKYEQLVYQWAVLGQMVIWTIFFLVVYSSNTARVGPMGPLAFSLISVATTAFTLYVNYFLLLPILLTHRKTGWYIFLISVLLLVNIVIALSTFAHSNYVDSPRLTILKFVCGVILMLIVSSLLKFVEVWFRNVKRFNEIQTMQLKTELKLLKAQISPHFLFNTLNNIYTLCLMKDDRAAPVVAKLANLLRHLIYNSEKETVRITDELEFLKHYVDLHLLRKQDESSVDFFVEGNMGDAEIIPLLFVNLVENIFKHSDYDENHRSVIKIHCKLMDATLSFSTENTIGSTNRKGEGIGIENLKKRLEMSYGGRYALNLSNDGKIYKTDLKINL